jgi:PAS domain S-box-containing protein
MPTAMSPTPPAVRPVPRGWERPVRPDELFFSTTDRRGLIRSGNSVFSRISGYSCDRLVGAPHNLVRHPEMPAGAFRLMWDRLLSGRPMAAYVLNLAADGAAYWVFATVTPHGDGFLSVRLAPQTALLDQVRGLYAAARAYERRIGAERTASRPEVAEAGAAFLEERLRRLGFADYDEFMRMALPAEVSARGSLVGTSFARPAATGPLAAVLAGAGQLDGQLEALVQRLERYGELAVELERSAGVVLEHARGLEQAVLDARAASAAVIGTAPVLANVAGVMAVPMSDSVRSLQDLSPRLRLLRDEVGELRFRIALARLHTEMVAAFAAEHVDGLGGGLGQVTELCDELAIGVHELAREAAAVNQVLHEVAEAVRGAEVLLEDFRRFLGQWRILVMRHRQVTALVDALDPIDALLERGHDQRDHLRALAGSCDLAVAPFDAAALEDAVIAIRRSAVLA